MMQLYNYDIVCTIMSELSIDKYKRSPPDFEALDQAAAEHDARLEYIPLKNYPELISSFHAIIQNLNHIRTSVGAPEMPDDISVVRLMNQTQWNNLHSNDSDVDAYYDPLSGNFYHLVDEKSYKESKVIQMMTVYTLAHELSHKATHGLEMYSFNLSEGMADFLTQHTLESGALIPIISKEELDDYRRRYLETGPVIINEYELRAKDIFVAPGEAGSGFTRIPQLRLIEALQAAMHPEHFGDFLRSAFTSDIALMRSILIEYFGKKLASTFEDTSESVSPQILTKKVLQTNT